MSVTGDVLTILASGARLTAPLAFAACGEYLAERAGTLNVSVEAMMLGAAFTAVAVGGPAGWPAGVLTGALIGLVHGTLTHRLAINTFVVGLVLNTLVLALTGYLATTSAPASHPVDRRPLVLLLVAVPLTWWLVERTRWGLELRAAGENPGAARVTGVRVGRRRRQALLWCGALAGLGGAYLALGEVGSFNPNMTAGRGYLVIAAVIFGGWRLGRTLLGCAVFGLADASRLALPALGVTLNSQLLIAAPYLLALLAMLTLATRDRRPRALGETP